MSEVIIIWLVNSITQMSVVSFMLPGQQQRWWWWWWWTNEL